MPGGPNESDSGVARRAVPRRRGEVHHGGPAPLPVPDGHRVRAPPSATRACDPWRCSSLVPVRKVGGRADVGGRLRPRPGDALPPPLHRPDPASRRAGLAVGDEAAVLASVQSVRSRRARTAAPSSTSWWSTGPDAWPSSSSTSPGGPSSSQAGTEAIFFGKVGEYRGTRQMVNPVVDVVAGVTPVAGRCGSCPSTRPRPRRG